MTDPLDVLLAYGRANTYTDAHRDEFTTAYEAVKTLLANYAAIGPEVWVVREETAVPHPAPCEHDNSLDCLNTILTAPLAMFRSRDEAIAYATRKYQIQRDEWLDINESYNYVVRQQYETRRGRWVCVNQQTIDIISAYFEPTT